MLRRLLIGLVIGLIVGGLLAAALVAGPLKILTFDGPAFAYIAAAVVGAVTGLVAGRPIWAQGAKIEAGLKAGFGALFGAGAMFALRQWAGGVVLDLHALGAGGPAAVSDLPAASLPLIAAVLGGLLELDNTGDPDKKGGSEKRKRVSSGETNGRARTPAEATDDPRAETEAEAGARRAGR